MSITLTLLRTELILLRRDTTAWTTAIALPFVLGAVWAVSDPPLGEGLGAIVVLQVLGLLVFTLHSVGTMALAARRDQLVLKRWRTSQAGPATVLAGTIGVPAGLVVVQAAVLTAITASLGGQLPASAAVLVLALLIGVVVIGALTFLAAAFTRSPEHAMITTFPVVLVLFAAVVWTLGRPLDPVDASVLALPGGAIVQLLRLGWEGPVGDGAAAWASAAAPSLAAGLAYAAAATAAAVRWFRWEPRS